MTLNQMVLYNGSNRFDKHMHAHALTHACLRCSLARSLARSLTLTHPTKVIKLKLKFTKLLIHSQFTTVQPPLKFGNGLVISYHIYKGCNYLSMLGLKLIRVCKRGHRPATLNNEQIAHIYICILTKITNDNTEFYLVFRIENTVGSNKNSRI